MAKFIIIGIVLLGVGVFFTLVIRNLVYDYKEKKERERKWKESCKH